MHAILTLSELRAAQARIAHAAVRTPLVRLDAPRLAAFDIRPSAEIYLKDESAQPIGSFKLRGAYNKISQLTPDELKRGVITYSSGNHAQGVAWSARALGSKAVIVMPSNAPRIKREATLALGAEVVEVGVASSDRKRKAEELAALHGYTIIPPYDDPAIIAGQSTCGLEILEQLPNVDLVLSPVSGGGLLSGTATAIKLGGSSPIPAVWGIEPELAADAKQSFDTRHLTEWPASDTSRTICDGLRTQSLGELNFAHILAHVDGILTVPESEIRLATQIILHCTDIVAEPSGAITLAAALFHADKLPPAQRIVCILSGGNIDPALRAELESQSLPAPV
jgi:threonine dehydratase